MVAEKKRNPVDSWRRLMLRVFLLTDSARSQAIILELQAISAQRKDADPTRTFQPQLQYHHKGTTLGQTQAHEQQVLDKGSRHLIMSPRHCPEGQQDKSVVCMSSVCGTLAEEPRRVHQGLDAFAAIAAEHQDDLSEQCRVPPLTAFAVDQSLDRLSHLDVVRAQAVNDCHPTLPWSDGDPHNYYTQRVRCLQVDNDTSAVQDTECLPTKPWTGMILYQTLPQDSVPTTSGSVTDADVDCIWNSLAAGQNLTDKCLQSEKCHEIGHLQLQNVS